MEKYLEITKNIINSFNARLEKCLNGDISLEAYHCNAEKTDENYINRLRISTALIVAFDEKDVKYEQLAHKLFLEELKDRANNPYQEIGSTVEILTEILARFNQHDKYSPLFSQMKNANFDCQCGYDIQLIWHDRSLEQYSLMERVWLLEILGYPKEVQKLKDYYSLNIDYEQKYISELAIALVESDEFDITSCYRALIKYYLEQENFQLALEYFIQSIPHLEKIYSPKPFYAVNLGRFMSEHCFDIMINLESSRAVLWKFIIIYFPDICNDRNENWYEKAMNVCKIMGNETMLTKVELEYKRFQSKRYIYDVK